MFEMTEGINHIRSRVFIVPGILILYDTKNIQVLCGIFWHLIFLHFLYRFWHGNRFRHNSILHNFGKSIVTNDKHILNAEQQKSFTKCQNRSIEPKHDRLQFCQACGLVKLLFDTPIYGSFLRLIHQAKFWLRCMTN